MYTRVQGKVGTLVQGGKGMGEHNTDQLSAGGVGGGHASPHSRWSGLGWGQFKIQQVSASGIEKDRDPGEQRGRGEGVGRDNGWGASSHSLCLGLGCWHPVLGSCDAARSSATLRRSRSL